MQVIKRDCSLQDFDKSKIYNAIIKAMQKSSGIKPKIAEEIAQEIEDEVSNTLDISVSDIEGIVYDKLITKKQRLVARAYEGYRAVREFQRDTVGSIDDKIFQVINGTDSNIKDNSNKNPTLISTMRDLVAEEVSKDMALRYMLPPDIVNAHNEGLIYIHDLGHYLNPSFNCFTYDTKFVTKNGVKSFKDYYDGENVEVVDMYGNWQKATVHKYSKKPMQKVILRSGKSKTTIRCTKDHRWVLKDGTITTNLSVGDTLCKLENINNSIIPLDFYFTLGFILGDGSDTLSGVEVRLCGDKNKYLPRFINCGYQISCICDNGDNILIKKGESLKQDFLNCKAWRYLNYNQIVEVFNGYYCADGSTDSNLIATSDHRLLEFIKYSSGICGKYISSIKENTIPTNFSSNRILYEVHFRTHTNQNNCWKVESIDRSDGTPRECWCVEQPANHTFTLANGVVTGNCCLINLEDMLQNGTVINGKKITKPHTFRTACTIATQIIAQVASGQFGFPINNCRIKTILTL